MRSFRAALGAALILVAGAVSVAAQDVTFTSRDGTVEITGDLMSFDGEYYRVATDFGELTLDGSGVICTGPGCPDLESYVAELAFSGAATAGEILMPALVEAFGLRFGYGIQRSDQAAGEVLYTLTEQDGERIAARFTIRSHSTAAGFADLIDGRADVAMALREAQPGERAAARASGIGDLRRRGQFRVLALDALVPLVAPGNPVQAITTAELADVMAGRITNWQQLGGPDAPIDVQLRDAASGPGQVAEARLLAPIRAQVADAVTRHDSDAALVAAVMDDPFALGIGLASNMGGAKALRLSGSCGFAIAADRISAKTEDYPLTAPVFLYMPPVRFPKIAREFLDYTRSPEAQLVIRRAGFVDQAPEEVPIQNQGDRFVNAIAHAGDETDLPELQRMVARLSPMQRLTLSFRFNAGGSSLDAQSRSNVELLARALENGDFDGRTLVLVGFSDGAGAAERNRNTAQRRAESVRDAILAEAQTMRARQVALEVDAFGEALPMACDDTAWGRKVNRRVEVWVR